MRKVIHGLFVLYLMTMGLFAQRGDSLEYQVKGAFLYNFTKFVEWPTTSFPETRTPLKICIFGADPFEGGLERLVENEQGERPRIVERPETIQQLRACHIAFVGESNGLRLREVLDGLRGAPVLTVGESSDFILEGGMINFAIERNRVRFDVNVAQAEEASLKISSKAIEAGALDALRRCAQLIC